jgi:hypothetical protein
LGIFECGFRVMDGARSDNDDQPISVLSMEDFSDGVAGFNDQRGRPFGDRQFGLDDTRRRKGIDLADMLIVDGSIHNRSSGLTRSPRIYEHSREVYMTIFNLLKSKNKSSTGRAPCLTGFF